MVIITTKSSGDKGSLSEYIGIIKHFLDYYFR